MMEECRKSVRRMCVGGIMCVEERMCIEGRMCRWWKSVRRVCVGGIICVEERMCEDEIMCVEECIRTLEGRLKAVFGETLHCYCCPLSGSGPDPGRLQPQMVWSRGHGGDRHPTEKPCLRHARTGMKHWQVCLGAKWFTWLPRCWLACTNSDSSSKPTLRVLTYQHHVYISEVVHVETCEPNVWFWGRYLKLFLRYTESMIVIVIINKLTCVCACACACMCMCVCAIMRLSQFVWVW